jgi:hypothetical protein
MSGAEREPTGRCIYCGWQCGAGLTCTHCRPLLWRDPYHLAEGADLLAAIGGSDELAGGEVATVSGEGHTPEGRNPRNGGI